MNMAKIVVVDDEPGIVALCERLLTRAGYQATTFTDPRAAMTYLNAESADLLLVDVRMPEVSGFDVVALAKQYQPDVAVLVMTGFGTLEMAIQALRQGVDGLILKPFEKAEIIKSVEQALQDNQRKQDAARMQALRPLFDVTELFLSETKPERLLELILNAVTEQLHCSNAGYYQLESATQRVALLRGRGITLPEEKSAPGAVAIGKADATQQAIILAPGAANSKTALQKMAVEAGLGALMIVPTSLPNLRSVIFAGREPSDPPFREVDLEMFLILARQASVAMENARLYEELWAYVQRVEESQQALVQAEKLAAAGRMTASIAHEINNPLQAVRNCVHLAARPDLPEAERAKYYEMTQNELDRLMGTVQRMLDFYRPTVERHPEQVAALMEHVLGLLSPQLRERGIRVTSNFSVKIPPVMVVGSQIQQVFINLILNAFDAMPNGGDLTISARALKKMVEITVQDTGPGIPPEMRATIFEPFTSTKQGGTGLGLSVSYGIITAHGGELDYVANAKPGACFRITLPAFDPKEPA
jgi:signal transduction histidine kinase/FixJ family two-component response regulator